MQKFGLKGDNGFVVIEIIEVYGFPDDTTHLGGYDCRCSINLENEGFKVNDEFYSSTGQMYELMLSLKKLYKDLSGKIIFSNTYEDNLMLEISMDSSYGRISIKGEYFRLSENEISMNFEINSDQSYIPSTINELESIYEIYGGLTGIKN